jgi:hypothetical protein
MQNLSSWTTFREIGFENGKVFSGLVPQYFTPVGVCDLSHSQLFPPLIGLKLGTGVFSLYFYV